MSLLSIYKNWVYFKINNYLLPLLVFLFFLFFHIYQISIEHVGDSHSIFVQLHYKILVFFFISIYWNLFLQHRSVNTNEFSIFTIENVAQNVRLQAKKMREFDPENKIVQNWVSFNTTNRSYYLLVIFQLKSTLISLKIYKQILCSSSLNAKCEVMNFYVKMTFAKISILTQNGTKKVLQ